VLAVVSPGRARTATSFVDAAKSPLNFSRATVKPQIAWPDVRSLPPAACHPGRPDRRGPTVPEHCRVTHHRAGDPLRGNLPATWTGRFYMSGNGGFAGEFSDSPPAPRARDRVAPRLVTPRPQHGHDATKEPWRASRSIRRR